MSESTDIVPADEQDVEVNPMVHLIAPVIAIIGTMVVRKMVNTAYERTTGKPAPLPRDPRTPMMRAILWTAVITTSTAVAEVAIYRAINRVGERRA